MPSSAAAVRKLPLILGITLTLLGLAVLVNLFGPVAKEEIKYQINSARDNSFECPQADFSISIPKLGICATVIPQVDPFDSQIYQRALARGVAHAAGSALPGEGNNIFLFAHSSGNPLDAARYNSIFYLLYKLEPGDPIELQYLGSKYVYRVEELTKASPSAVTYLDPTDHGETLTLMTCWPPGTTLKRLIVVAKPEGL